MGIDPQLGHDHIRLEPINQGRHDFIKSPNEGLVIGVGVERHVDAVPFARPLAQFLDKAGAGEDKAARLVEGDGQDTIIAVKGGLHAIAVVGVDVDVDHPPAGVEHMLDGDGPIPKDAEAGSKIPPGVMQPPGVAKDHISLIL